MVDEEIDLGRGVTLDPRRRVVRRDGGIVRLTPTENRLLELFVRNQSSIVHQWQEAGSGPWNSAGVVRSVDDPAAFMAAVGAVAAAPARVDAGA